MEIKLFSESVLRPSAKWAAWKKMSWLIGSHQEPGLAGGVGSVFTWPSLGFLWLPLSEMEIFGWNNDLWTKLCRGLCNFLYCISSGKPLEAQLPDENWKTMSGCYSDQEFWFLTLLPREVAEQGCLCQQWTDCLGSSFLGNWTTAIGELSFFSKSILNKIRI